MQDMVIEHMHCMQIFCRLLSYQMPVHVIVRLFAMAARKNTELNVCQHYEPPGNDPSNTKSRGQLLKC